MTINSEQIQALKAAAEKATPGEWGIQFGDEIYASDGVNHEQIAMLFSDNSARDAEFIAAANPAAILSLLAEHDADKALIAELKPIAAHAQRGWQEAHEQEALVEQAMTRIDEQAKRIAELEKKHCGGSLMEREDHHAGVVNKLLERIAELEARKLTVKLPSARRVRLVSGEYVNGWTAYDVLCGVSNAGITLVVEE